MTPWNRKKLVVLLVSALLVFTNIFAAAAAPFEATVTSKVVTGDGKTTATVNTVIEAVYGDWEKMTDITFAMLDQSGNAVGTPIVKPRPSDADITVTNEVYSIRFDDLAFAGLTPGNSYTLKASYNGASGLLTQQKTINLLPAGMQFAIERTAAGGSTPVAAQDNTIQSSDQSVVVTLKDEYGNPIPNKSVLFYYTEYSSISLTTDADGKIKLIENGATTFGQPISPVMFLQVNTDQESYYVDAIYVDDLVKQKFPNSYIVEARYLDKDGNYFRANTGTNRFVDGWNEVDSRPGIDVVFMKQSTSGFTKQVKQSNDSSEYLFYLSAQDLMPAEGKRKQLVLDGRELSKVSFNYQWAGSPITVDKLSLHMNDQYKQVFHYSQTELQSNALYVQQGIPYQVTAVGSISADAKVIVRDEIKAKAETSVMEAGKSLAAADYMPVKINAGYLSHDQASIRVGYINEKFNYSEVLLNNANGGTVYVAKGVPIHKIGVRVDEINSEAIVASNFTPSQSEYTFQAGIQTQATVKKYKKTNYGADLTKPREQFVLGETIHFEMTAVDENNVPIDYENGIRADVKKGGQVIAKDQHVRYIWPNEDEAWLRGLELDWKPTDAGSYTVSFKRGYNANESVVAETTFDVLPKKELELELKDKNGSLIDLVKRPYLTEEEAAGLTVTVREHLTGKIGLPVAGVEVKWYDQVVGKTNENGVVEFQDGYSAGYEGNYTLSKAGYLDRIFPLAIIDPATEAVVRVSGLDKPETMPNHTGGVQMDEATVYATIQAGGQIMKQQQQIAAGATETLLVVPSPSVVGVDMVRASRIHNQVDSPYGYYMVGSIKTEPGKEYSMVIDARQSNQLVSKVNLSAEMDELWIVRKDAAGLEYLPYMTDNNMFFYATQGKYSVLANVNGSTLLYLNEVDFNQGENTLSLNADLAQLARLQIQDGTLESVTYLTDKQSELRAWARNSKLVYLTPGNVEVGVNKFDGKREYVYNVRFTGEQLKAGQTTTVETGSIAGLDVFGLDANNAIARPANVSYVRIGLEDSAGQAIERISTPKLWVYLGGSMSGSHSSQPEVAKYTIKDQQGEVVRTGSSTYYPISAYVPNDGTYTVEAELTVDGKAYTLNKTFTVSTLTESIDGPEVGDGGEEIGGDNPSNGDDNDDSAPTGPSAPGTDTVSKDVDTDNKKLDDLLKNGDASDAEKAKQAADLLSSIATSIKKVNSEKDAVQTVQNVSQTLANATKLLESMKSAEEKAKVVDTISTLVSNSAYAFNKVENGQQAVELTKNLIKDVSGVLGKLDGTGAAKQEALKQSVLQVSKQAVDKAATVKLDANSLKVEGNAVNAQLDAKLVEKQIQEAKNAIALLSKDLSDLVGEDRVSKLKPAITISIPKQADGVNKLAAEFPSDIVNTVKNSGMEGLKLEMGNIGFTVEPDTFGEVEDGKSISLAAEVVQNVALSTPTSVEKIAEIPVMEFSASIGEEKVKKFNKPMPVAFDVSSIDTSKYTAEDLENLTVYLLNENTLTWEAVGGVYNPITQSVEVLRSHFSKYTVMLPSLKYSDVDAKHWANKEINQLLGKGILDETAAFSPDAKVTREQFAAWVARAYGLDGNGLAHPFADVTTDNPYADEIAAAYGEGLINGRSASEFDPKGAITRQEIAALLIRAMKKFDGVDPAESDAEQVLASFTDGQAIAKWARQEVATLKQLELLTGYEDGSFQPRRSTDKDEAAALIYRLYNR